MAEPHQSKAALRKKALRRRDALTEADRSALSDAVINRVLDLPAYRDSRLVLAYASFGSELQTDSFLRRVLEDGKTLLLPKVDQSQRRLRLFRIADLDDDLRPGLWGIREPRDGLGTLAEPRAVDFALVPGVAFDRRGGRLGYGAGFYDALISGDLTRDTALVSGAFECQMVEEVPMEPHDARVDLVITEAGHYPSNGRSAT